MTPPRWRPLGPSAVRIAGEPGPLSGRVTAIALDASAPGDTAYVGAALGGVWRTDDGGAHWEPIADQLPWLAVGALAVAPTNPDWVYIGTGDQALALRGQGIYRFDRSAGTLTRLQSPVSNVWIAAIVVDPGDADHVFVATNDGVWERTVPGGSEVWTPLPGPVDVTDLIWDPTTPGYLFAGADDGIWRRRGADAFALMPDPRGPPPPGKKHDSARVALAQCETARNTMYAVFADASRYQGIFRTDAAHDGTAPASGPAWKTVSQPLDRLGQFRYNLALAVHPRNRDTVFLGNLYLFRSTDGGARWENVSWERNGMHSDQHTIAIEPPSTSELRELKLWCGNDGGVWRSQDGGSSWSARNRGLQTMQLYSVAHHPVAPGVLLAGAQDNGVQRRLGTALWEHVSGGDGIETVIDPAVPTLFYASHQEGMIFRSTRGGRSFEFLGVPSDAEFSFPLAIEPGSPEGTASALWAGTRRLLRSVDRGSSFRWMTSDLIGERGGRISVFAFAPSDPGRIYAGTSRGSLWRVDQRGGSWSQAPAASDLSAALRPHIVENPTWVGTTNKHPFVSDIAVHPADPDTVYVSVGPTRSAHPEIFPATQRVFASTDGGNTFAPLPVPPPLVLDGLALPVELNPANTLVIDPAHPEHLFVGCDVGVFRYNATASPPIIEEWRNGLLNTPVTDLEIHPGARRLRAATHGRGVWEVDLDKDAAAVPQVEVHLGDTYVDLGVSATPASAADPLDPSRQLRGTLSPDVLLDTPGVFKTGFRLPSTVDFTPTGDLDYIGFELLGTGSDPRRGKDAMVYVRVANRGPADATAVKVRAFWAEEASGGYPALPADFWSSFPDSDPADTASWKPIGLAKSIQALSAREPAIVSWLWPVPRSAGSDIRLLAAITCAEDPINPPAGTDSEFAALSSRFVAVRDFDVSMAERTIQLILVAVGAAVVVGGAAAVYVAVKD